MYCTGRDRTSLFIFIKSVHANEGPNSQINSVNSDFFLFFPPFLPRPFPEVNGRGQHAAIKLQGLGMGGDA